MSPDERLRSRVRRLFLATIAFVLVQIAWKETYPGLHAPGFGDPGSPSRVAGLADRPAGRVALVHVRFEGGGEASFALLDLLPRAHHKQRHVVAHALVRALRDADASARDWLRREVRARYPGRTPGQIELRAAARRGPEPVELLYADPGDAA